MTGRRLATLIAALILCARPSGARGDDGVRWEAHPVAFPVAPDNVRPRAPEVPSATPTRQGVVTVAPGAAAAFHLPPLALVRVRAAGLVQIARLSGGGGRARLPVPGLPVEPGVRYLVEPPSGGGTWLITADRPTAVRVEAPVVLRGRLRWEQARADLRAWIDRGGPLPELPVAPGVTRLALELRAQAAVGAVLARRDPALAGAVRGWRAAAAMIALEVVRPRTGWAERGDAVAIARGAEPRELRGYRRMERDRVAEVALDGPGVLELDVRALGLTADTRRTITVEVESGGRPIASRSEETGPGSADGAPSAAFPRPVPLPLGASSRVALALPLYLGHHRYRVRVAGAPAAVRAKVWRHRSRLGAVVRGGDGAGDLARRARRALAGHRGAAADTLRALLDQLDGAAVPGPNDPVARAMAAAAGDPARRVAVALALDDSAAPRSAGVGLCELGWRRAPVDGAVRAACLERWFRRARWSRVAPAPPTTSAPPPPAETWIDRSPSVGGSLALVPAGASTVVAPASPLESSRPAVLRLYVVAPADRRAPIGLAVDGHRFAALPMDDVEVLDLAVAPGPHALSLATADGIDVLSALPVIGAAAAPGRSLRRRRYVLAAGVRYELPDPGNPSPIRVELRPPAGTAPRVVTVRFDVGPPRRIDLRPGPRDAELRPVGGAPALAAGADVVLWAPPGARSLTIDGGDDLFAAVYVRRDGGVGSDEADAPPPLVPAAAPGSGDPLADVAALSRQLAAEPGDVTHLVARADRLLELGAPGWARHDLVRARAAAHTAAEAAAVDDLALRIDGWLDPAHLPVPAAPLAGPTPLSAGLTALGDRPSELARWVRVARGIDRPTAAAPAWVRARVAERDGDGAAAAAILAHAYVAGAPPAVGLEALRALVPVLERADATASARAPLAYAIAAEVRRTVDHPIARRAAVLAARASGWQAVTGADDSAGFERLYVPRDEARSEPLALVAALVAAPWPAAAGPVITGGHAAAWRVDLERPVAVAPELWCAAIRTRPDGAEPPCRVTVRVDDAAGAEVTVAPRQRLRLDPIALAPGRHQVEVALASTRASALAVRFTTERPLGGAEDGDRRRVRALVATADHPLRLTAAGPGALALAVRRRGAAATRVALTVRDPGGGVVARSIALPSAADPAVLGDAARGLEVGGRVALVLPLVAAGGHVVELRPDRGAVLVTASVRVPAPAEPPESLAWQRRLQSQPPSPSWPYLVDVVPIDAPLLSAAERAWLSRTGGHPPMTLTALAGVGRDDADVVGLETGAGLTRGELRLELRKRARRSLWLGGGLRSRIFSGSQPSIGGDVGADWRGPAGWRAAVDGRAQSQAVDGGDRLWGLRGRARGGVRLDLSPDLWLVPSLVYTQRHYSGAPADPTGVDPLVWNAYGALHDRALDAQARLRWRPLQDAAATASLFAVSNRDLRTVDHTGVALGVDGVVTGLPLGPATWHLGYAPNLRLADTDRSRSYLRHDLGARLRLAAWTGRRGRIAVELSDQLYLSAIAPVRNAFSVAIRYDLTSGRGLTDFSPSELVYRDFEEERVWEPR